MNNKTIFRQLDDRWRKLPFPGGGYTLGGSGCGCCAVTHILIELDKYKDYTPAKVQPFMKQYATKQGLYHSGIDNAFKHYGVDYIFVSASDPMNKAWNTLKKDGYRAGVLLFYSKKGPDGTVWTGSGHFIAFVDYKIKNGKHWFYLKDSGDRVSTHVNINGKKVKEKHSGWWCYENSMKGDLPKLWIVKIPAATKKAYSGDYPDITVTETVTVSGADKLIAEAKELAWPLGTEKSKYAYKGGAPTAAFKEALEKVYTEAERKKWGVAPRKGASCDVAVSVPIRMTLDPKFPRGLSEQSPYKSDAFTKTVHTSKPNPYKLARRGDVVWYDYKGPGAHIVIVGDGVIYEAGYQSTYFHTSKAPSGMNKTVEKVIIFRPKDVTEKRTRSYLKKGDTGSEVMKLQKFLAWYGYDITADGIFGGKTEAAVRTFQTANGLTADGLVGAATLAAMKKVVK